ncbi:arginine N-succinyltransferase [Pokkaliibacter sp. MBI-7]|uniref:arginine N-succinyltransferase n=1 Tax=Pokkaliibacter sp. MBI-7 TaxID=3040600 RepID=UPI00244BC085|nr:arginine N-succinyltransferase [Pokkaliibacter sp. MBI-7]MDH2431825.1 arginine N-succinyltransferase [Pokkaliibacter sp. MBI-7]
MMVVRPIQAEDRDALHELARKTGPGFTSLQDDDQQISAKIENGLAAFIEQSRDGEASYVFVMEDLSQGRVVGICAIEAAVGLHDPWYTYHVGVQVHASRELNVYTRHETLTLNNNHTGYSELCTLFLDPEYRQGKNGHLLSKSRFMFMAEHPERFYHSVIAEMRGFSEDGVSPFWEGLGRTFFSMDFAQADQLSAKDKGFIAELMPKHTIYTHLLPSAAQAAIGQTHEHTTPARRLLESEGFRYNNYVDIFDAGPTLEARVQDIRAIRESRYVKVQVGETSGRGELSLLATLSLADFRCCMAHTDALGQGIITINQQTADALGVKSGATLRTVGLFGRS